MAVFARKKGDETNDHLQNRFKRQVQNLGIMKLLRSRSVFSKKPNKRSTRLRAVKREEYRTRNKKKQFYSNM